MTRRIAVTGASGMIGSAVATRLAADGHDVVMLDRRRSDRPLPDAAFVETDLRDRARVAEALRGVEVVCHLGEIPNVGNGNSDREVFDTNTAVCRSMLDASLGCGVARFIYASSCQQYGYWGDNRYPVDVTPARWPLDEFQPAAPRNAYAHSKAVNEVACRETSVRSGLESMIFRFPWVMRPNPGEPRSGDLLPGEQRAPGRWLKSDEAPGEGFWTYLDLRDAVEAFSLAARPDRPFEPLHARCEAFHFVADDVLGTGSTRQKLARHLPNFAALPADWPERRPPVDCAKAGRFLGWTPRHRIADPPGIV